MDESDIDLFLSETNAQHSSFYIEPPLSLTPTSSETNPISDIEFGLMDPIKTMEERPHPFIFQGNPMNPKESHHSAHFQNFSTENTLVNPKEQLPSVLSNNEKQQFQYELSQPSYINFETGSSQLMYGSFAPRSNFTNAMGELLNHDREAVMSFLAGQVRSGPDVAQIYRCNECCVEFPNAQAFGGHMSSHSKSKRTSDAEGGNSKRSKQSGTEAASKNRRQRKGKASRGEKRKKKSVGMRVVDK